MFVCFLAFIGRHQVLFGIVPIDVEYASSESCKSIYPVAVANSQENRLEPGLSLRFQVAGYLLLVAGEVDYYMVQIAVKRGRVMLICVRDHVEVHPQKKKEVLYFVKKTWEK